MIETSVISGTPDRTWRPFAEQARRHQLECRVLRTAGPDGPVERTVGRTNGQPVRISRDLLTRRSSEPVSRILPRLFLPHGQV